MRVVPAGGATWRERAERAIRGAAAAQGIAAAGATAAARATTAPRATTAAWGTAMVVAALAAVIGLGACTHVARSLPADGATPRQVLDAYLLALQAGDCATTHAYAVDRFLTDGELCGHTNVPSYRSDDYTSKPSADQVVLAATLTTKGGDQSLQDGGSGP